MLLEALEATEHSPRAAGLEIARHKNGGTFHVEAFLERLKPELGERMLRNICLWLI